MSSAKKISPIGGMSSLEPKKDFAYYVPWVREATELYDLAIENDVDGEEKELRKKNKKALEQCQELCEVLLADYDLPLEHRILLSYYLCAHRENHVRIFYLKQALATVEVLEDLEGKIDPDPMREILETQLKSAEEKAYAPRPPVGFVDNTQHGPHKKSFIPSTQHAPYMQYSSHMQHGPKMQQYDHQMQPVAYTQHGAQMQSFVPSTQHTSYMQHDPQMQQNGPQMQPAAHTQHGSQMQSFAPIQYGLPDQRVPHMQAFVSMEHAPKKQLVSHMQHGPQMQYGPQMHSFAPMEHGRSMPHGLQMPSFAPMEHNHPMPHGPLMQHVAAMQHVHQIQHVRHMQAIAQKLPVAQILTVTPTPPGPGNGSFGNASQGFSMTAARQPLTPAVIITEPSPLDERREVRRRAIQKIREATARRERENALKKGNMEGDMNTK